MALDSRLEILKSLKASPVILRGLVRDLSDAQIRWRPSDNEWAVIEVVAHIADTDERALGRLRQMLAEVEPALPSFDQEELARQRNYIALDLQKELDRYESIRRQHLTALRDMGDACWQRVGRHGEHGLMSVELYESHVASEDVDHLAQVANLIQQLESSPILEV